MTTSAIFNGRSISNTANEAIRENRQAELMQRIAQMRADQNSFTTAKPSGSGTRPAPDTTGPIAFHGGSPEVAGSMGLHKPDLGTSFGSGVETAGTIAFHGGSPEVAGSMGLHKPDLGTSFGSGVETAGPIAFHGGSPEVAGSMGMAANEADLSFQGGLGIREIKRYNANTLISDGEHNIAQGKALISASQRPENAHCATSLKSQGESKINEGKRQIAKGKAQLSKIK